jgi:type I restriction enzyme M protein
MISVRPNFFYTRTVPCELWHFDRAKPADRRDQVLMIDARNIYRKVTRKIYDFSPEQLQNLTAIVWLYRGQSDRFVTLIQQYLERTLGEASRISGTSAAFQKAYEALTQELAPFVKTVPKDSPLHELVKNRDDAARACFDSLQKWTTFIAKKGRKPCDAKLVVQKELLAELDELATACRDLIKDVDLVFKVATRLVDSAEKDAKAKEQEEWDGRAIGKLEKELDARRKETVAQLKAVAYFQRQAHWLVSRFPEAKLVAVPGLVKLVERVLSRILNIFSPALYIGRIQTTFDPIYHRQYQKQYQIERSRVGLSAELPISAPEFLRLCVQMTPI